jgi:hypothetical protein
LEAEVGDIRGGGARPVPEFMCPLEGCERWHFLEENATQQQRFQAIAILEPV